MGPLENWWIHIAKESGVRFTLVSLLNQSPSAIDGPDDIDYEKGPDASIKRIKREANRADQVDQEVVLCADAETRMTAEQKPQ